MNKEDYIDKFTKIYQEYNICKSFIIVETDEEVKNLYEILKENDYSPIALLDDIIFDERRVCIHKLQCFKESIYRMIIMTYQTWYIIKKEAEIYILPEQNMIITSNISDDNSKYIERWFRDAKKRGFVDLYRMNYFLKLENI